jgi:hypothetical protein
MRGGGGALIAIIIVTIIIIAGIVAFLVYSKNNTTSLDSPDESSGNVDGSDGRCWLKKNNMVSFDTSTNDSGFRLNSGDCLAGYKKFSDFDIDDDSDLGTGSGSLSACQVSCNNETGCRAFAFNTTTGICYLKNRNNMTQVKSKDNFVSGFKI